MKNKKILIKQIDSQNKKIKSFNRYLKTLRKEPLPKKVKVPAVQFSDKLEKDTAEGLKEYRDKKFKIVLLNEYKYEFRTLMLHFVEVSYLRFEPYRIFDIVIFGIGIRFQWRK